LFLTGVLVWQLASWQALGAWSARLSRRDTPWGYWFAVAAQTAILIAFLLTGKTWHMR
jgi:hypothetical protein